MKNRTSIVVPPKIVLLMQNGDIVYGYNVSIRQKYGAGKGLPSSYFGWFVLDTKKRKCWLGLTIEELGVILDDYQIERLGFGKTDFRQRRHQKWEIDYNFIDKILMYVTPTLLTIAIIVICKIVMMVLLWVQRSLSWLELTDID
ncbi:MAG: hypothetical protein LBU65_04465 [Planctomycetaceae bacterium]|nr:hypothetical protein [Planctomycetaceae bacterium]